MATYVAEALNDPTLYFETLIWTGNGNTPRILTGLDFQPDMVWSKRRDDAAGHNLLDSVRGAGANSELCPSSTGVEGSNAAETYGYLSAFTADGFTVTEGSSDNAYWNNNTATYVAWCWKAGTSFSNDASATSIGSIDSSGSASSDAGFSICSYTGSGSAATIKHGLSSVPKMIITKDKDNSNAWYVYHVSNGNTHGLRLSATDAKEDDATLWNDTNPTSSVYSVGSNTGTNRSANPIIAYCFAEKQGFSKFGSYTGNGNADGTFVYTGFKPAFLMVKITNTTNNWMMWDNKREDVPGANENDNMLRANVSDAELADNNMDFLSNGFKFKKVSAGYNGSGNTYIYMAFAEAPFVNSKGVPCNAR